MSINIGMQDLKQVMLHGRLYTCHPKDMGRYERDWLMHLYTDISRKSRFTKNHLINLTWIDINKEKQDFEFYTDQEDPNTTKIWLSGSVDGLSILDSAKFYTDLLNKGFTISKVGFSDEHWNSWFPYWVYDHNIKHNVTLNDINFLYLNYNRKPHSHRRNLVEKLIENKLLDLGYVTFEKDIFPEVDSRTANTELDYYDNILKTQPYLQPVKAEHLDLRYSRPEDATTLGDLNVWNSCYLNIISETTEGDPYQISEKTYKPIIGLRPFILNGHPNIYTILRKLGFYTTMNFFDDFTLEFGGVEPIIRLISHLSLLSKTELYNLYQKQLPMLIANRERFIEICNLDRSNILDWSQIKQ